VAAPDAQDAGRGDLEARQGQFVGDAERAVAGMGECMVENRFFDILGHPIRMGHAGAGDLVEQSVGAVCLEVPPDLVKLLAAVAHHPAGLADVAEVGGEFEQAELAPCYFLVSCPWSCRSP